MKLFNKQANSYWRKTFGLLLITAPVYAAGPLWIYSAPSPANVIVSNGGTATVQYTVTNQSTKPKNLVLQPNSALSATPCYLAGKGSSCTITLTINGSLIPREGLHNGPIFCTSGNINQCYQPSLPNMLNVTKNTVADTSLQISTSALALSVSGLTEYGIPSVGQTTNSGVPRTITITNTGASTAVYVTYTVSPSLPSGTSISPSSCGNIAPSGTCVLTITPGPIPSAAVGNTNPTPVVLNISGVNTNTVSSSLNILTYGSVFGGGYVFSFDDTAPTNGSVTGKVWSLTDQEPPSILGGGIIWSSNGTFDFVDYFNIPGIYENSTTPCIGNIEGNCNTNQILAHYTPITTYPLAYYAAGLCRQPISGYNDWYLPAICELSFGSDPGCGDNIIPTIQNIESNLIQTGAIIIPVIAWDYWSSTEYSVDPTNRSWMAYLAVSGYSVLRTNKNNHFGSRCVRAF